MRTYGEGLYPAVERTEDDDEHFIGSVARGQRSEVTDRVMVKVTHH